MSRPGARGADARREYGAGGPTHRRRPRGSRMPPEAAHALCWLSPQRVRGGARPASATARVCQAHAVKTWAWPIPDSCRFRRFPGLATHGCQRRAPGGNAPRHGDRPTGTDRHRRWDVRTDASRRVDAVGAGTGCEPICRFGIPSNATSASHRRSPGPRPRLPGGPGAIRPGDLFD